MGNELGPDDPIRRDPVRCGCSVETGTIHRGLRARRLGWHVAGGVLGVANSAGVTERIKLSDPAH